MFQLFQNPKVDFMGKRRLSARDALHVALMEREGIEHIMSFDHGFDGLPGVTRLGA